MLGPVTRPAARGLTLVELLVGLALGLLVVAGGTTLLANQLREHRSLIIEARLMQDLRTAADVVARDLRRAGHWGDAGAGVGSAGQSCARQPLRRDRARAARPRTPRACAIRATSTENHVVDSNEQFGFRLRNRAIEIQLGSGNWQALTDATLLAVTEFDVAPTVADIDLDALCSQPCPAGSSDCPPRQHLRSLALKIMRTPWRTRPSPAASRECARPQRSSGRRLPGVTQGSSVMNLRTIRARRRRAHHHAALAVRDDAGRRRREPEPDLRATLVGQPVALDACLRSGRGRPRVGTGDAQQRYRHRRQLRAERRPWRHVVPPPLRQLRCSEPEFHAARLERRRVRRPPSGGVRTHRWRMVLQLSEQRPPDARRATRRRLAPCLRAAIRGRGPAGTRMWHWLRPIRPCLPARARRRATRRGKCPGADHARPAARAGEPAGCSPHGTRRHHGRRYALPRQYGCREWRSDGAGRWQRRTRERGPCHRARCAGCELDRGAGR